MALIKCPECTKEVSNKALMCPFCGFPITRHPAAHKDRHQETLKKLEHKRAEDLEVEYACLKILFTILESEELKDIDYEDISYLDDTNDNELVILSEKYKTNKIIRKSDFLTNFNYSPNAFMFFLHVNGATNERVSNRNKQSVGYYMHETKETLIPKVGEYYLDGFTGFWKKASITDIECLEKKRKESLYMHFETAQETVQETAQEA